MRSSRCLTCLVMAGALLVAASSFAASHAEKSKAAPAAAKTDAKKADAPRTDAAHDAAMAEMMKYAAPGEAHAKLKSIAGRWKASVKSWNAPGEPQVSEGVSENSLVLGGRYVKQEFKASMMDQAFEGVGYTGYDNKRGVYTMVWADNMSTALMTGDGSMNAKGDELVMKTRMDGPDGKPTDCRLVTKIVDDNKHVFSMHAMMDGKEQLMMEITYTRM